MLAEVLKYMESVSLQCYKSLVREQWVDRGYTGIRDTETHNNTEVLGETAGGGIKKYRL